MRSYKPRRSERLMKNAAEERSSIAEAPRDDKDTCNNRKGRQAAAVAQPSHVATRASRRLSKSSSASSGSDKPVRHRGAAVKRSKTAATEEDDRKPPAKSLAAPQKQENKKRPAPKGSSSKASATNKRKKTTRKSPELKVSTAPPLTRGRYQKTLNQVTPSPASATAREMCISKYPKAFSFSSPVPNRKKKSQSKSSLPEGVIDLYSASDDFAPIHACTTCNATGDVCSSESLGASFIQSYGKEYWQRMKDNEEPAIHPPSPASSRSSCGTRSSHQNLFCSPNQYHYSSPDSADSIMSLQTPDHRRDWVYIDTSCLSVTKPDESTHFLHYQPELTPKMRSILVDWIIELSEHFHFGQTTLHLAVTIVDKVLACGPLSMDQDDIYEDDSDYEDCEESKTGCFLISRERFQLLGAASTWLACKVEESNPPSVSEIAYVSDNIYDVEQIKRMERRICTALDFSLYHQTPFPYMYEFLRASRECPNPYCSDKFSPKFQHMVSYLMELGRLPYGPVTQKPSLLTAAAVYLARVTLGVESSDVSIDAKGRWTPTLQHYTGYTKSELKETVFAIHSYQMAAEESSLKAAFTKYKNKKYHRVALKTVPLKSDLGF